MISAASLLLSLLVARPANRRLEHAERQTITRVLLFADIALIATVVVFGLAHAFWLALVAMLATNTIRTKLATVQGTQIPAPYGGRNRASNYNGLRRFAMYSTY